MYVMSQQCISMGVFREREFSVNQVPIKLFNVVFDTGALQRLYISKSLVDSHTGQWKNSIRKSACVVRLADQTTKNNTSEVITGAIGFVDDEGRKVRAVVEAIVCEMPKIDFI